jgi:2-hydroxy-6-oxonona-2,4-dienedioate hydrolase
MTFWTDLLGLPFEVSYIDAGGIKTRRLVAGKGEPVVFLHGISGHLETFVSVLPHFVKAGFQVHMIDMLGQGFTGATGKVLSVAAMSKHLIDYLDACGLPKAHLVGLSLGGWTAATTAANHPERIFKMTLIAPAGDPNSLPARDPKFSEVQRKSTLDGVRNNDKALTRKRLEMAVASPTALTDEIVDCRYIVYHRPEFQANIENLVAMFNMETFNQEALKPQLLARITAPTLVVFGQEDPGQGNAEYLKKGIAHIKVQIFEGTGHWPAFERPEDFGNIAAAFHRGGLDAVVEGTLPKGEHVVRAA